MTTSATSFLSQILDGDAIPSRRRAHFRARLQDRFYELIVGHFLKLERAGKMTRADLARRIDKDPAQITRYLAAPGNWTLETVSDLALAVAASEVDASFLPLARFVEAGTKPNYLCQPIETAASYSNAVTQSNRLVMLQYKDAA